MLKAILRKGLIVPQEPLPQEWEEGACLEIILADAPEVNIDTWFNAMELLCADSPLEQEEKMQLAINEHRQKAKEQMRREMGPNIMEKSFMNCSEKGGPYRK